MKWFHANIEQDTLNNANFRKVLYTAKHMQLVLMSLLPNEDIWTETHPDNDQFFRFETWKGKCIIDGNEYEVSDGSAIIVPAGSQHNVINLSDSEPLRFYTIYAPAHHKDWTIHPTKDFALSHDEEFDGVVTEEK